MTAMKMWQTETNDINNVKKEQKWSYQLIPNQQFLISAVRPLAFSTVYFTILLIPCVMFVDCYDEEIL